jgi:type IV secretion system protein VirB8
VSDATELQPYFEHARSWEADRAELLRRSERRAWMIAGAGWLCAIATGAAIAALTPLKRVEPFVVRVDSRSGIVDVVPMYDAHQSIPEAVSRYFLSHYVTTCERFNLDTAESDYEECAAFHSAQRNAKWYALWTRSNPSSPLNLYKDGSSVRSEVESVTFFQRASGASDLAQIRYRKVMRRAGEVADGPTYWIATVSYAYAAPSADPRVRRWNPLGFRVLEVHSEPEVQEREPIAPALADKGRGS